MNFFPRFYFSFPVRLLVLHFRNHLVLLALWLALALMMTGVVGRFFGLHYVLLSPEYCGKVNFWSYLLTGAAFGVFFMIWNLTTYLLSAYRFPFLATLDAPFTKFSLNNSLIPLAFLATYLVAITWFQWHDEFTSSGAIAWNIGGFLLGVIGLVSLLAVYLYFTNKDIGAFLRPGKFIPRPGSQLLIPGYRIPTIYEIQVGSTRWRTDTYLTERLRPRLVRSVAHYNPELLSQVFRQNHLNAVVVQLVALLLLLVLGLFMDKAWARIPTAATFFLLASMVMSMFGAITFWFRSWGTIVFLGLLVVVNTLTSWGVFNYHNHAYGLDYRADNRADYSYPNFEKIAHPDTVACDLAATRSILDRWLLKNQSPQDPRPKLVLLCVSGGGLRSALWTMQTLQQTDRLTQGKLLKRTAFITGASGGMLGAGLVRELILRQHNGEGVSPQDTSFIQDLGKDLLNPVTFAIIANDLFVPLTDFRSGNFRYAKDRGYLFERQLNENCRGYFSRRLADYRRPEAEAIVPMMLLSPFILNDARRLLISPQGVSYLMRPPDASLNPEIDGVDFGRLCRDQQADSLAFTSALRMNCTYPLILPNVWLPTTPAVEVVDAGFRDNYGLSLATRFVQNFRDWITSNTSGVVIVQIRCWEKLPTIAKSDTKGILETIFTPADAVANLTRMQDYDQDASLALLADLLGKNRLQIIPFYYRPVRKQREASLSLHLSKREKLDLMQAYYSVENQKSVQALQQALR
ncbi:MAG: patatin-like phospholipase family protein [Saprospiraceae bacterium]